jgi:alpha-glucosidase
MREFTAAVPWRAKAASMALLGSHDTARFRTVVGGDRERHGVGAVLLFTAPDVPMVFAGDEIGLAGRLGEDARRPMPWHAPQDWDEETLDRYARLARLRRSSEALTRGGLRWVDASPDSLTYLREAPGERLLVHVSRAAHRAVRLPVRRLGAAAAETLEGADAVVVGGALVLPSAGPAAHVWRLHAG